MTTLSPLSGSPGAGVKVDNSPLHHALSSSAPAATTNMSAAKPATKSKPRKRVNTAEKRHQHNAIERQRRETLNVKFISLARLLPSLANHRRPSKSAIVNGSIAHLTHQREQRLMASRLLRQICAERDALAKECNEWRYANGILPRDSVPATSWNEDMEEVCNVEKETFGTFASMDEGDDDGDADDTVSSIDQNAMPRNMSMSLEQAAAVAAQATFGPQGLLTPRPSADAGMASMPLVGSGSWAQQSQQDMFVPPSLSNSTASLPFNAFMSESDSVSPANSGFSGHMPTPPTTASGSFIAQLPQVQHTPSPRSTNSVDEAGVAQSHQQQQQQHQPWTEQQLLFLRAIQQQQRQNAQSQSQQVPSNNGSAQTPFNPLAFTNAGAAAAAFGLTPNGLSPGASSPNDVSASPFQFFASVFPQQQQQQQQQQMSALPSGVFNPRCSSSMPVPPTLSRAHSEHLESWGKPVGQASMLSAFRAGMGMGMAWDQGQQSQMNGRAVEGYC